jgi:hypothetical protein
MCLMCGSIHFALWVFLTTEKSRSTFAQTLTHRRGDHRIFGADADLLVHRHRVEHAPLGGASE